MTKKFSNPNYILNNFSLVSISIILIILAIFLIFIYTPKVGEQDKNATIFVQMFEGPEAEAMIPTVAYWNEHYANKTGITVLTFPLNRVGYFTKLKVQLMSGMTSPDIVHPFSLQLGELMPYLEPLDDYLKDEKFMTSPSGEKLSLDSFLPIALKTINSSDGKMYMLPKDMSEVILYYRKDLISNPPQTWDELVRVAKNYTRSLNPDSSTKYGIVLQGKYEIWTFCAALETIWSYGGSIFLPGTENPGFDNEAAINAFKIFEELANASTFPLEVINAEHPEVAGIIQEGDVAMAIQWTAFYQDLINKEKSPNVYDKFEIALPPGVRQEDGSINRSIYVQTINLAINKNSKHKEAAMRFLAWATMGEGAEIYAKGKPPLPGGSSPINSVWKDDHILDLYPKIYPWIGQYGRAIPVHPDIGEIMLIGSSWVQRVLAKSVTAEEASKGLNQEIADLLKRRNKK